MVHQPAVREKQMREVMVIVALMLVGALGLTWVVQGNDFFLYQFFAPKYEQVRRETFEQSRAFNEGMAQELNRMWLDYQHATDQGEKDSIRSLVRQRVAGYDLTNLQNPQLRLFVQQMMAGN
jgi:hypothetical protein